MRILLSILIFYRKLFIPTVALTFLSGLMGYILNGQLSFVSVGGSYFFLGLLMHYFIYEIRNSNEYYFYHNMGLSRRSLWVSTFVLDLLMALILMTL